MPQSNFKKKKGGHENEVDHEKVKSFTGLQDTQAKDARTNRQIKQLCVIDGAHFAAGARSN
jgi:hypothetical protein